METKKCSKCGRELSKSEFYKHPRANDGLQSFCKECAKEAAQNSRIKKKSQSGGAEVKAPVEHPKHKVYTNPVLAPITPIEMMLELKARGYEGELVFKEYIVKEHRISLGKLN